ncbi:MAG: hypothetical protein AAB263_03005 [Planctomycetota bacterium]
MNHILYTLCLSLALFSSTSLTAFEVTKNINTGKPPVEKSVLFAKDAKHDHVILAETGNGQFAFSEDGSIVSTIKGSKEIAPRLSWKAGDGRPASIDVTAYTYLILTCRMEGNVQETNAKGKVIEKRADNLWFSVNLYNAANQRIGAVSLADVNDSKEGTTPAETTELRIPLILFAGSAFEDKLVTTIGTDWKATASNQSRNFRWVIDRIALAN